MLKYDEAKILMIQSLSRAADYHEAGAYEKLGGDFDKVDIALPRHQGSKFLNLYIAFQFWDGWIDASNHQWQYYPGIRPEDWPRLARRIIVDLKAERPISDPLLLEWFGPKKTAGWRELVVSFSRKIVSLFDSNKMDRKEARSLLLKHLSVYKHWPYDKLQSLVGDEVVLELTGASGTRYYFQIYVAPVSEIHDDLLVEASIYQTVGRRWLPEVEQAEFGISSDNNIYHQSQGLETYE